MTKGSHRGSVPTCNCHNCIHHTLFISAHINNGLLQGELVGKLLLLHTNSISMFIIAITE